MSRFAVQHALHRCIASLTTIGLFFLIFTTTAAAATFAAILTASQNTFSSATLQVEGTVGSNHCYSTGVGSGGTVSTNSSTCTSGSPVPTGSLSSSSSSSATTTLASPGTTNASATVLGSTACGVAQLADSSTATQWGGTAPNTALAFNGLTYQNGGPFSPATTAITTDGSAGWAETTTKYTNPQTFTVLAWFKTSSATGSIIGFSDNQTAPTSAGNFDRMLWIDATGHLVWATYTAEITSSGTYANGAWHFVAVAVDGTGTILYVDGAQVGTSGYDAQSYNGWWSIGVSGVKNNGYWGDQPTSAYFNGSLAQIAIMPSKLIATQVTALNGDTTLSSFSAGVNALSPANYWALNDSGQSPYEGTVAAPSPSTNLADNSGSATANTATTQGGVTLGVAGGPVGGQSISLDGSTGWVQTTTQYTDPVTFSVVAWFKTSTSSGGNIISFTDNQGTSGQNAWDRLLYVDNAGHLVWGVNDGSFPTNELTSTSTYNNGAWHMAVAEIGAAGQQLWVDGTEVASNSAVHSAQNFNGWWHLGWGVEYGWGNGPTSNYLNGSLSQVAIIPSQLSSTQISTLYNAGTSAAFTLDVAAISPSAYWPLQEATTLIDATTNANTGTAQGGVTLGVTGPSTIGTGAISLDGSSGWVQTTTAYNPQTFSAVAWFKTSTTSGGNIIAFTNHQGNSTPSNWDRLLWVDNTGHLVWAVNPSGSSTQYVTSGSAYNNGAWHMVVAEIGSAGQQLWVDGTEVASNSGITAAQNYTGYWHIGWGWEQYQSNGPNNNYLNGSLSQVAVIPSQLSSTQISALYTAGTSAAFMLDMGSLAPTSYWPLQDSASNICGGSQITVQQTVASTNTCIYPSASGACAAPSSANLVTGLGVRTITAPTSSTSVTITITMKLTSASPAGVLGLHELDGICFGMTKSATRWSAQIIYPSASVQL